MIMTIDEYIAALQRLRDMESGDTILLCFDRILTDKQADALDGCKFDSIHTAIEEVIP
jgi:hypothetical protein